MAIAESTHWYTREGLPAYETLSADGKKMVKTTVVHARKHRYLGSPTTVIDTLAKYNLIKWLVEWGIELGCDHPGRESFLELREKHRLGQIPFTEYYQARSHFMDAVWELVDRKSSDPADTGTEIHKACEQRLRGEDYDQRWAPWVERVTAKLSDFAPVAEMVPEKTFACLEYEYGGRPDVFAPGIVFDLKGRAADKLDVVYPEERLQLAAYGYPLKASRHVSVHICRESPDVVAIEHAPEDIATAFAAFLALLKFFQISRGLPCPQLNGVAR